MIRYRALGAAGVMGESAHLVTLGDAAVLLDAGCHPKTGATPSLRPAQAAGVRAVVLSHAHLDHAGGLPAAMRDLPTCPVVATAGTRALAEVALLDHLSRCRALAGRGGLPFSEGEVRGLPWRIQAFASEAPLWPGGPLCTLLDAGHIAGSAGVLLAHGGRRVFYSGDVHLADRAWQRGATWPTVPIDVLVVETTQGGHAALDGLTQGDLEARLIGRLGEVLARGGRALLPVFAFGKAQEMLALLARAQASGALPAAPIFVGGLARRVNGLADAHMAAAARSAPAVDLGAVRVRALGPDHVMRPPEGPALFLAGSGMLAEGSLAHGLAAALAADPQSVVLFVGYLDPETPGFALRGAAERSEGRIEHVPFSAHACRADLVAAITRLAPRHTVLVHGDEAARDWVAAALAEACPATIVHRPRPQEVLDLGGTGCALR